MKGFLQEYPLNLLASSVLAPHLHERNQASKLQHQTKLPPVVEEVLGDALFGVLHLEKLPPTFMQISSQQKSPHTKITK
jgi:hypothetical protein